MLAKIAKKNYNIIGEIIELFLVKISFLMRLFLNLNILILLENQKLYAEIINSIDYIIAVPISYKRFLERGYNQSKLIAYSVSKSLKIPYANLCLIKIKHNKRQSELHISERHTNTNGVYKVFSQNRINGKNILLIDDIYTTGSTVNECCKTLKQAGASRIFVATIAKAL